MQRKETQFEFRDIIRPMSEEVFAEVELAVRSLREEDNEWLIVEFKNKIDNLMFIQAVSNESYKLVHIEIAFPRKEKKFPQLLMLNDVPVNEAVEVFKSFCCSDKNPDLSEWIDITERIMKANNINDD